MDKSSRDGVRHARGSGRRGLATEVGASFERFCLAAGVSALSEMMEQDAIELCGPRYAHKDGKAAHRWGR